MKMLKFITASLLGIFFVFNLPAENRNNNFLPEEVEIAKNIYVLMKKFHEQITQVIKTKAAVPGLDEAFEPMRVLNIYHSSDLDEIHFLCSLFNILKEDNQSVEQIRKNNFKIGDIDVMCKACHGSGKGYTNKNCKACNGNGISKSGVNNAIKQIATKYTSLLQQRGILEHCIANIRIIGIEGLPQDHARAAELYRIATNADRKESALLYAYCLVHGIGVNEDKAKAEKIMKQLIKQSYKPAYGLWAIMLFQKGENDQAVTYFEKSGYPYFSDTVDNNLLLYYSPFQIDCEMAISAAKCADCASKYYDRRTVKLYAYSADQYQDPEAIEWIENYKKFLRTPQRCGQCGGSGQCSLYHNERVWVPGRRITGGIFSPGYYINKPTYIGEGVCSDCGGKGEIFPQSFL